MKQNKNIAIFGISLVLVILTTSFVSAFGVSIPYMENKELYLSPGEQTDFKAVLQNGGGATIGLTARVIIDKGSDIISIVDEDNLYQMEVGKKTDVNMLIKIPENAKIGDRHVIRLQFSTAPDSESGEFAFGSSIQQLFEIVIGEKVKPSAEKPGDETDGKASSQTGGLNITYLLTIIIAVAIIAFVVKSIKKNRQTKKI